MREKGALSDLIGTLQKAVKCGGLNKKTIDDAIQSLTEIGYRYDADRFPPLVDTDKFTDGSTNTPTNLAEALLWKLGNWNSYKTFVAQYVAKDAKPTTKAVVFFAFAKHLKDRNNPIYDQHAIRAVWAICDKLTSQEKEQCRSLLFKRKGKQKGKWKRAGSGGTTVQCYKLFVKHINGLVDADNGATKSELDRLLMPLGQAIKSSTDSYANFRKLCGWLGDG